MNKTMHFPHSSKFHFEDGVRKFKVDTLDKFTQCGRY